MSMRKQFVQTVSRCLHADERLVLLLGDIGVFGFRDAFRAFPQRVYNIGILEQATVSMAAGLAKTGLIPIIHTIAPFLTERCLEQIKLDFGYQNLGGNFVTVGGSYDYAALGCSHHCPGDVQVVTSIPGMEVVVPGSAAEFDHLFHQRYNSGKPSYFRLSEVENPASHELSFGKATVLQTGQAATVIAVGTALKPVMEAVKAFDVTVLYYATVSPFDRETLRAHAGTHKILLCEPYFRGGLTAEIMETLWPNPVQLATVGMPKQFFTNYGNVEEHNEAIGFTPSQIRIKLAELIHV